MSDSPPAHKPASDPPEAASGPDPLRAEEKRLESVRVSRRTVFLRRLILPLLGIMLLSGFILIGRDWTNRREYLASLAELQQRIADFQREHHRLPHGDEVKAFTLNSRLKAFDIRYDASHLLDDSPGDVPLAYSARLNLRFLPSGHAVLDISGQVHWMGTETLNEKIQKRDRHWNASLLQDRP